MKLFKTLFIFLLVSLIFNSGLNLDFSFGFSVVQAIEDPGDGGTAPPPDPDANDIEDGTWLMSAGTGDCCEISIPIPLPVKARGYGPGSQPPVRVASDAFQDPAEGVYVWSGDRGRFAGVRVWNLETDAMWTRCIPSDPVCAYFIALGDQEQNKAAEFKIAEELYIQVNFNQFSKDCPTFAKMAGIGMTEGENPEAIVVNTIAESSCKNIVENWADALVEKTKAVKLALSEYIEDLDLVFLDPITKKALIQQVNSNDSYEEVPEPLRPQAFFTDVVGGSYVEANTSLLGFVRRATRPMSKANLFLTAKSYVSQEQQRAEDALLEETRSGGGLFSKYETTSEVVDTQTGKKYPGKQIVTLPSSVGFEDLMTVRRAASDALVNTIDYTKEVSNQLFPVLNSGDNLWYGGISQLRDLLNTTMTGGPGLFRTGSSAPQPEVTGPTAQSSCSISFADSGMTMGLKETMTFSFSVRVNLAVGLPGTISDIENIKLSFDTAGIASVTPNDLTAANATTSSGIFRVNVGSIKSGSTDMNIDAKLKASAGGSTCRASIGVDVFNIERYACNSQKCSSPTVNPDPDNIIYTCVGTPDDGLNNDCTSLGSNCKQEWCTDIGDQNKDGFNAMCYDSCGAEYQDSCRRIGYFCQGTSTSLFMRKENKVLEFIKSLSLIKS